MAFTNANLHLLAGAVGDLPYEYDAGSDTMATVATPGYFNNSDDDTNFQAEDSIHCYCSDGNFWLRVSAVSSGSVTTQFAGGDLPVVELGTNTNTATTAVGASAELAQPVVVGIYEEGTLHSTASRYVLDTPYAGAEVVVRRDNSASLGHTFDAGGSGATGITFDSVGNRRMTLLTEGDFFHVVGVSTTRWRIKSAYLGGTILARPAGT